MPPSDSHLHGLDYTPHRTAGRTFAGVVMPLTVVCGFSVVGAIFAGCVTCWVTIARSGTDADLLILLLGIPFGIVALLLLFLATVWAFKFPRTLAWRLAGLAIPAIALLAGVVVGWWLAK